MWTILGSEVENPLGEPWSLSSNQSYLGYIVNPFETWWYFRNLGSHQVLIWHSAINIGIVALLSLITFRPFCGMCCWLWLCANIWEDKHLCQIITLCFQTFTEEGLLFRVIPPQTLGPLIPEHHEILKNFRLDIRNLTSNQVWTVDKKYERDALWNSNRLLWEACGAAFCISASCMYQTYTASQIWTRL